MKKKLLIGFIAGAAVFAAVYGSAASLGTIGAGDVGAGSDAISACQDGGLETSYTVAWDTTEYVVTSVTVSGIEATCDGQDVAIALDDVDQGAKTYTDATDSGELTWNNLTVSALDLSGLDIAIYDN